MVINGRSGVVGFMATGRQWIGLAPMDCTMVTIIGTATIYYPKHMWTMSGAEDGDQWPQWACQLHGHQPAMNWS